MGILFSGLVYSVYSYIFTGILFLDLGKFFFYNLVENLVCATDMDPSPSTPSIPVITRFPFLCVMSQSSSCSFCVFNFFFLHSGLSDPITLFCVQVLIGPPACPGRPLRLSLHFIIGY